MEPFRYEAPTTVEAAIKLLAHGNGDARPLAGGTDLIVQMRTGRRQPSVVVDLKHIPDLASVRFEGGALRLGAAVSCSEIREHPEIQRVFPGLYESVELIGSEQIQGRASVGGNLCNGSPAADTVPPLVVLGAIARVVGPDGSREVPVESFVENPGQTALRSGELLIELLIPMPPERSADAYLRFIPRTEMDIAVVGAAAAVTLDTEGRCTAARIALGAVGPTILRVPEAEEAIVGSALGPEDLERAATLSSQAARPIDDLRGPAWYRRHVSGVLTRRALARAHERAARRD